jgi:nucleoside-triphosphatase THEP1
MHVADVFLLTGKPRIGKSTAIREVIRLIGADRCGGFYTEEIRADGERISFKCVTLDGREAVIAHVDDPSPVRVGRYGVNVGSFDTLGIPALRDAIDSKPVVVVDEFGFMQLESAQFRMLLDELVYGGKIVVGTIYANEHADFDWIKHAEGVRLFMLTEDNRAYIPAIVALEVSRLLGD